MATGWSLSVSWTAPPNPRYNGTAAIRCSPRMRVPRSRFSPWARTSFWSCLSWTTSSRAMLACTRSKRRTRWARCPPPSILISAVSIYNQAHPPKICVTEIVVLQSVKVGLLFISPYAFRSWILWSKFSTFFFCKISDFLLFFFSNGWTKRKVSGISHTGGVWQRRAKLVTRGKTKFGLRRRPNFGIRWCT